MYEAREQEDILQELQAASGTPASKIEGTFENDMLAANSLEFAKVEVELEQAYKAAFAETSWGDYLTMIAAQFGVDRKRAGKAKGIVTVTGTGSVSKGSRFATAAGTLFVATQNVDAVGSADVPVEAVLEGAAGNAAAGTVNVIPMSIPGISAVTNKAPMADGYDEESDEALLKRYYIAVRTPATSGNVYHYFNWAMSVKGVGNCKILPLWNGPGTVKVLIIDSNRQTASRELIKNVADYIETVRPIGATVTVASPTPLAITVTVAVKGILDADACKKAINARLAKTALSATYLSAAQVIDIIMNQSSVEDCDNVLLNDTPRLSIGADVLPVVEEVKVSALST